VGVVASSALVEVAFLAILHVLMLSPHSVWKLCAMGMARTFSRRGTVQSLCDTILLWCVNVQ